MNSPRSNHFGNPFVTATVGSNDGNSQHGKAPTSPSSTISRNDNLGSKLTSRQSIEKLMMTKHTKHQQQHLVRRPTTSSFSVDHRGSISPNVSFTEREPPFTTSRRDESPSVPLFVPNERSILMGSTTAPASTIGLPSHYPGSAGHYRNNSLESEELQDFDDMFEKGPISSLDSIRHNDDGSDHGDNFRKECLSPRSPNSHLGGCYDACEDDYDDLNQFSLSLSIDHRQHSRNLSELSSMTLNNIPSLVLLSPKKPAGTDQTRASSCSVCSSGSHQRSSNRSISSTRSHRRSRNLAMGSNEFQNAVLEEL